MQFRHWKKGRIERFYLSDVPGLSGTAYIAVKGKGLTLEADRFDEEPSTVLLTIAEELGIAEQVRSDLTGRGHLMYAAMLERSQMPTHRPSKSPVQQSRSYSAPVPAFRGQAYGTDLNFANIKNPLPILIEVDHREPEQIDAYLRQVENLVVERKHLPLGDYRINDGRILVERKSVQDFANSVQSGHVFDQAQRMGFEQEVVGVVIVEGDVFGAHTGMLHSAITGALTCLSFVQRMNLFQTTSLEHTAFALAKLGQHDRNGLGYNLPLHKDKPTALIDAQRYVLEAVTGISAGNADTLLKHFGTVKAVFAATPEQLLAVKGIGPKTAARLHELATRQYAG